MRSVKLDEATEDTVCMSAPDPVLLAPAQFDRAAFASLYNRNFDPIFRFCFYRLGDWHAAEDAASDVFAKALGSLHRVRVNDCDDGLRCWLFTIARHIVANHHRDHARHPAQTLESAPDLVAGDADPEAAYLVADDHRLLVGLLEQLKPDQRDLLELRLSGLNDAQIARVLGRRHDAVRKEQSRTIKALMALASTLEKGGRSD